MIRLFGYFVSKTYLYLGIVEASVFFAGFHFGTLARFGWTLPDDPSAVGLPGMALIFAGVMSVSLVAMGLYQRGMKEREAGFLVRLAVGFFPGTALLTVLFYTVPTFFVSRDVFGLSLLSSFVGITLVRELFTRFASADARKRRVLVLGTGVNAQSIERLLCEDSSVGFTVAGYLQLPNSARLVPVSKLVEPDGSLLDLAIVKEADEIVVAADDRRGKLPVDELIDCKMSGFEVMDLLTFFEKELAIVKIDLLHPSWIFFSSGFRIGVSGLYGKRLFDLVLGSLMLIATAPIMLLVALASLIEYRGRAPVLYHQVRVGQNGKLFRLHKFRSMCVDAEADGVARWTSENDKRVTALGAFLRKNRIDELPQVFNVLKGQMSLVGPRPERPEFVERFGSRIPYYAERHRVKPGVTGWAQLLYPYGSDEDDAKRKLEFDLYYVKHAGIALDMIILLQTVGVVLVGKGAR